MNLLIADDHQVVRQGLRYVVESIPGMEVVGETGHADEIVKLLAATRIDLLILDYAMPGWDTHAIGAYLAKKNKDIKILIYTAQTTPSVLSSLKKSQFTGIVIKQEPTQILIEALHSIRDGNRYLSPLTKQLINTNTVELTARELQILHLLSQSITSNHISSQLGIDIETVRTYEKRLKTKLQAKNKAELLLSAHEMLTT